MYFCSDFVKVEAADFATFHPDRCAEFECLRVTQQGTSRVVFRHVHLFSFHHETIVLDETGLRAYALGMRYENGSKVVPPPLALVVQRVTPRRCDRKCTVESFMEAMERYNRSKFTGVEADAEMVRKTAHMENVLTFARHSPISERQCLIEAYAQQRIPMNRAWWTIPSSGQKWPPSTAASAATTTQDDVLSHDDS